MDLINTLQTTGKPFEPTFLNIEYFFNRVFDIFGGFSGSTINTFNLYVAPWLSQALIFLAVLFFVGIIILIFKIKKIREAENKSLDKIIGETPGYAEKNERWELVLNHLNSSHPSDWRLAILEADNILDEMVKKMGYDGENLGERLRAVEVSDFTNLQNAWEAHKVRNRIAHEGGTFELTKKETDRVIQLYEKVFREFEYI